MTNERAIELLNRISDSQFDGVHGDERREALEMAVRALSGDGDLISRDDAIMAVKTGALSAATIFGRTDEGATAYYETVKAIKALPSAQPEIIRCTECKHYREYDSKYVENAVVVQCMADRYPISEIIPDGWFCAGAERKDDE